MAKRDEASENVSKSVLVTEGSTFEIPNQELSAFQW